MDSLKSLLLAATAAREQHATDTHLYIALLELVCDDTADAALREQAKGDLPTFKGHMEASGRAMRAAAERLADAVDAVRVTFSADEMLTPREVASRTGTAESGWRNKAAAGLVPGAVKKGKQWLIPAGVAVAGESAPEPR